ncbi:MAG: ATP-binding protein [Desulfobacterales bacterium]|nr:ATP-binding protein [Desulfobacterales bacterium]
MDLRSVIKDILKENRGTRPKTLKKRSFDVNSLLEKKTNKINTFTGFRRVGKTYLMFLIMENLKDESYIYFNFEDERIPESTDTLTQLLYAIEELYSLQLGILFLDEIHIIPGWSKFLRRLMDQGYQVFVTGSSSKLGLKEIPTELRGRTRNHLIFPLAFQEYLAFKNIRTNDVDSHQQAEINRMFDEYLVYGGFPEIYDADEIERKEVLQEYYRTLVQRDLIERFNIKQEALLKATIKLLLNSLTISISKLTKTLASIGFRCSKNTISNYISYMESSFFLNQAFYYSKNVKDQLQYPRKVYFIDNGFLKYLSLNPDKGRSLENLVAVELKRRGYNLFYWKNLKGEEVDFVIIDNESVSQLIQVCYNMILEDTREREIRALKKGMQHFGVDKGIILTLNQTEIITDDNFEIEVIPASRWLLEN